MEPGRGTDEATTIAIALYVVYNVSAHRDERRGGSRIGSSDTASGPGCWRRDLAIAYLGFTRDTTSWLALVPWFALAGVGIGSAETAEHAAVAHAAPLAIRGSAFGLLAAVQSFGNLAASAIAGLLWTALSPSWAFRVPRRSDDRRHRFDRPLGGRR